MKSFKLAYLNESTQSILIIKLQMPAKKKQQDDESFSATSESEESIVGNYTIIPFENRIKLIEMVCIEKKQILTASSSLGIKISTAKYILRCFRKNGKILKKNLDRSIENQEFEKQLMALKEKVEEINRKKKQRRNKKQRVQAKLQILNTVEELKKVEQSKNKIKAAQEIEESNSQKAQSLNHQQTASNLSGQNMYYYVFYNLYWVQPRVGQTMMT